MTEPSTIVGLVVPMITPLTDEEGVDEPAIQRLVDFLIGAGTDVLFILGSNGEGATLRPRVRHQVVDLVVAATAGRIAVVAGALEPGTTRVVDEVDALSGRGLTAYVVTTPFYFTGHSDDELHSHFSRVADRADAPVILYNLPSVTGNPISTALVSRLASHGNVGGIKDSSGDWEQVQRLIAERPQPGFSILQGDQARSADAMLVGADGLVPGYANVRPDLFRELIDAARTGDSAETRKHQDRIDGLLARRGRATIHANKVLAQAMGLTGDAVTQPLPRLSIEEAADLVRGAQDVGALA